MRFLPKTENAQVLRTDFSSETAWNEIQAIIRTPEPTHGFRANVEYIDDREYEGIDVEQILTLIPLGYNHSYIFVADRTASAMAEHPLLVVDLENEVGKSFRVILPEVCSVENNLSIANMDFDEFADNVDPDGVFRGFPR